MTRRNLGRRRGIKTDDRRSKIFPIKDKRLEWLDKLLCFFGWHRWSTWEPRLAWMFARRCQCCGMIQYVPGELIKGKGEG